MLGYMRLSAWMHLRGVQSDCNVLPRLATSRGGCAAASAAAGGVPGWWEGCTRRLHQQGRAGCMALGVWEGSWMGSCESSIMCAGKEAGCIRVRCRQVALLLALRDTRLLISAPPAPPAWLRQHLQHHCCACHTDRYCVLLPDCPAGLLRAAAPGVVRFGGVHAPAHLPRPGAGATP